MIELFKSQMDYILLVYGLSFFILAATSLLLIKTKEIKLPWLWLGLFGFSHAINEWLDILSVSLGDNYVFSLLRLVAIMLAFVFLAEFSWLSFLALKGKAFNQWFFIPWLFLVYLGWYFGKGDGFNFTCRYFLGFVSAFSAGIILIWHALKLKGIQKRLIFALGFFIGSYSFTQLVILSPPFFLKTTLFNQDIFAQSLGFPIQLLRCILIMCAAFINLTYWYFVQGGLDRGGLNKGRSKRVLLIGSVYLILIISGWLITRNIGAYFKQSNVDELLAKADTAAAAVNFRRVETLTATIADIGTPDYKRLKEQLKAIDEANVDLISVYLMRFDKGRIVFLVDSDPAYPVISSSPGQVYEDAPLELKRKFLSHQAFIIDAYTDRWGNWISAYAPIVNLENNKIVALVGMDMDVGIWQQKMFRHRLLGIFISFCVFILLTVFFVINEINQASAEKIEVSEKHLQTLIDNIPNPVFYKNTQGIYLGCNFSFTQFFGLTKEVVIGKTVFDINPRQPAEMNSRVDAQLFSLPSGGSKIYETEIFDAQGIKHSVLLNKSTYPGPDGKIAGLVGVMQDITERKRISDELDQAAQEWQRTFDSMSDIVFIQDKDFTILKANKACLEALKLKSEDVVGKKCFTVMHYLDHPWMNCPYVQTCSDQKVHTAEVDDPGLGASLLVTTSPIIKENGEFMGSIHVAKDISLIKKYQDELELKNKELEKLDQLKSDFVSMVSHELRSPLSITKEGLSLVLDGVTGTINARQSKILTTSKNSIDRLARIINSLLDISKIESGRVELKKQSVDMEALIRNVAVEFENQAKDKGLELRVNLTNAKGLSLYIDEDRIIQVFTNLISNSIKFTEEGHIDVSLVQRKNEVEFTVSDTGVGFAAEDLPRVFTKFLQFGRTAGVGGKGSGLGLSISKGIIDLHRGKIWVESEVGKGSKFIFSLPKYSMDQNAREYIEDAIADAIKSSSCMTLAIAAVSYPDGMKDVYNDLADELFKVIKTQLYREKDLALKYPNEFIVIMEDCDKNNGLIVQSRIELALRSYLEKINFSKDLKIIFGLAIYPDDANNYQDLVNKAKSV